MARDHARIQVAIWSDPDFKCLPVEAQHMYLLLLSQPRLSYCGVLDYLPSRLATMTGGSDEETVDHSVKLLEADRFLIVDRQTHELMIRTFIRHDGLLASPNVTKAMVRDYVTVLSEPIQEVIGDELAKAYQKDRSLGGWKALRDGSPNLWLKASGKGSQKGSGK